MPEPEPEKIHLACIGCGTMNPIEAEICAGCCHRFAGPIGHPAVEMIASQIPDPPRPIRSFPLADRPRDQPTALGCFARGVGILLTIVATFIAFVVAFFATCSSLWNQETGIAWSFAAGLGAAGVVIAIAVGIARLIRSSRQSQDRIDWRG